jgi:phosphoglycolate phosphatase
MNTVIFDLDGTLSDSAEGIVKSINYALPKLGYNEKPEKDLLQFIGPQLGFAFTTLTGKEDEAFLSEAIKFFRERYFSIGYKENVLYEGIKEVLKQLIEQGNILCIATTKRKDIAEKVLRFFEIDRYFEQVHGADLYRKKADLLRDMLSDPAVNNRPMIMIGDRDTDFKAANEVNMPSIAVKWGYGNEKEFGYATRVVEKPDQLPETIRETARRVTMINLL